jgi:hypothetical protein
MGRPNRAWILLLPRRCFKLFWKKSVGGLRSKKQFSGAIQSAEKKASEMAGVKENKPAIS